MKTDSLRNIKKKNIQLFINFFFAALHQERLRNMVN